MSTNHSSFSFWDRQQTSLLSFDPPCRHRLESLDCVRECIGEMTVRYEKKDRLLYGICRQRCRKRCIIISVLVSAENASGVASDD